MCIAQTHSRESESVHCVLAVNYLLQNKSKRHQSYLHPRQVTLNWRMSHGDAAWICASSKNAGLSCPRLHLFTVPAVVPLMLASFQGSWSHGPTESRPRYFYAERKCPSTHAGVPLLCRNNPKSPKTAEQANSRLLMLTPKLQARNPQC